MKSLALKLLMGILRLLAKMTVFKYKPEMIGVTGTVGKTSAKLAIGAALRNGKRVRASAKSYNNELGLPLTILGDWESTEGPWFWPRVVISSLWRLIVRSKNYPHCIVLEYGIDRPGDMRKLLSIARPAVGVLTAMGSTPVHIEFFSGPDAVLREKAKLIAQLPATGFAILNADNKAVMSVKNQTRAQVVTFGFTEGADVKITTFAQAVIGNSAEVSFKLLHAGSFVPIKLEGVLGRTQAYAAAAAAAVGLASGINLVTIAESFKFYHAPNGRLKVVKGIKGTLIIDDTYNASPIAVSEALYTIKGLKPKRAIAVLGDMLELGKYTLEEHETIGRFAAKTVNILLTVGLRGKFMAEAALRAGFPRRSVFSFMNVVEAGMFLQNKIQKGDVILIKGSQGVRLEKVVKEIMAEPLEAQRLLVRQSKVWDAKPGLYDI
ncbi:MAG: Mur ligase family protein [Patescibacteria group bacterium]